MHLSSINPICKNSSPKAVFLCSSFILLTIFAIAGPYNIANKATISASTVLNNNFKPENISDGIIGIDGKGEWACVGDTTDWGYVRFPWIELTWNQPQVINKIVL